MNDWNSEYVIFESASGERKVHRNNYFPHKGWTHKRLKDPYATKVLTLEQVLAKDKRYFQGLAKTNKSFKEKEKKLDWNDGGLDYKKDLAEICLKYID